MPETPKNLYHEIIQTASPKIAAFIQDLEATKQVDHDNYGEPLICKLEDASTKSKRIVFVRNGIFVNAVVNGRKKTDDGKIHVVSRSWDQNDGWTRPDTQPVRVGPPPNPRGERQRRQAVSETSEPREKYVEAMQGIIDVVRR